MYWVVARSSVWTLATGAGGWDDVNKSQEVAAEHSHYVSHADSNSSATGYVEKCEDLP
jgi:hypothetical protein